MSWKSFVSAGLLCLLASPAFAQIIADQPDLVIAKNGTEASGHLNSDGDWAWRVYLLPDKDLVPDGSGTPMAAELGFKELLSQLVSVNGGVTSPPANQVLTGTSTGADGDGFDDPNPGNQIFTWETLTDLGGDGECNSGNPGNCPVGVQFDASVDEIFAALGSENFGEDAIEVDPNDYGWRPYIDIVISGPSSAGSLSTTIQVSGAYDGKGRIAQITGMDGPNYITENFDDYDGSFTRVAQPGDSDLTGDVDGLDLDDVLENFFIDDGQRRWYHGDFDGTNDVDGLDLDAVLQNFFAAAYDVGGERPDPLDGGSGAGGGGAVPEPATVTLLALAGLGLAGLRRRRS